MEKKVPKRYHSEHNTKSRINNNNFHKVEILINNREEKHSPMDGAEQEKEESLDKPRELKNRRHD